MMTLERSSEGDKSSNDMGKEGRRSRRRKSRSQRSDGGDLRVNVNKQ